MFDAATEAYLRSRFSEYYRTFPALQVANPEQREWMFVNLADGVARHLFYPEGVSLCHDLVQRAPKGVFHSVGRYLDPRNATNHDEIKARWSGLSDLPIDVDRKPGPVPDGDGFPSLGAALEHARASTRTILGILQDELAIPRGHYKIRFSGSKGFHILLEDQPYVNLSNRARRELSSYLTGNGCKLTTIFPGPGKDTIQLPDEAPVSGFPNRLWRGFKAIRLMARTRHPELLRIMAKALARNQELRRTRSVDQLLNDFLASDRIGDYLTAIKSERTFWFDVARELTSPSIDTAVLQNVHGMIRLTGSINGKSGLLCRLIPEKDLETFTPVEQANPFPKDTTLTVRGNFTRKLEGADSYGITKNETTRLPTHAAIVFLATGSATLEEIPA